VFLKEDVFMKDPNIYSVNMYLMPSISDGAGYEPTAMLSEDIKG
jgi:hypothetical protein